jgi:hypothetical protein
VHHMAAFGLVASAALSPETRPFWAVGVLIEFNTIFLIAQRNVESGIVQNILRFFLLASWIPLRFGIPLYLLWTLWAMLATGAIDRLAVGVMASSVAILLVCQTWWTYKLYQAVTAPAVLRTGL